MVQKVGGFGTIDHNNGRFSELNFFHLLFWYDLFGQDNHKDEGSKIF
jgi:hypothetical protein